MDRADLAGESHWTRQHPNHVGSESRGSGVVRLANDRRTPSASARARARAPNARTERQQTGSARRALSALLHPRSRQTRRRSAGEPLTPPPCMTASARVSSPHGWWRRQQVSARDRPPGIKPKPVRRAMRLAPNYISPGRSVDETADAVALGRRQSSLSPG